MKKLISMLLALAMVLSLTAVTFATEASAAEAPSAGYSEAPSITELGTYGNVEDRLPVEEDIFVSQHDAVGAELEIGAYGGTAAAPGIFPDPAWRPLSGAIPMAPTIPTSSRAMSTMRITRFGPSICAKA